ncbi:hypothetical protein P8452_60649 [Trifolium repens]|nr:hypothetical protein P8452_60649 [Trifolium repens]
MNSEKRRTLPLKVKLPDLESLRDLSTKLTSISRSAFIFKYGNILDLLFTDVQFEALTALAQFYDPPMRCFLFQDFQLAPTLEEFERIIGIPLKGKGPFVEIGHPPTVKKLAEALNIGVLEFASNVTTKGKVPGFLRSYLEEKARKFAASRDMKSFNNVLALLVYGLVLFPSSENFVDFSAISVFWAVLSKDKDPVPALLADVYYALHMRHDKQGGNIICCFPLLYCWFASHLCKDQSQLKKMDRYEWSQFLASLTKNVIRWYPRKLDIKEIIISCGEFPNVPLIGSKACINYNPVLALRQLGRPMWEKPDEKSLECLVIDDMGAQDPVMLQKVIRAWGRINKRGSEWKSRVGASKETYRQWVKERVQKVKLPFIVEAPIPPKSPEPIPISIEEADELKATIAQLNKEKEELQASLLKATQENSELKWEKVQKDKIIEGSNKRLRIEEDEGRKVRDCLGGANSQLKHKNKERDELLSIAYKLKGQWEKSQVDVKELKEELENVRQHLHNMVNEYEGYVSSERLQREAVERTLVRSQFELKKTQESLEDFKKISDRQGEAYENLKRESEEWERRYVNLVNSVESGTLFRILRHEGVHWKSMFSRLAKLANNVIETIPTKLVAADATMHSLNTPLEVIAFVEFCKTMMKDFREKIKKI